MPMPIMIMPAMPVPILQGYHIAVGVVVMVVVMMVQRQAVRHRRTEQGAEFRIADNGIGPPGATDMMVQADHPIRRRHHHMQVM